MGRRRLGRHRLADRLHRRRVGGHPGRAGRHRHRGRRRCGVGRRHAVRHARADRSRHRHGDDDDRRRQPARVVWPLGMGRYGWPTAATEPSRAWTRKPTASPPRSGRAEPPNLGRDRWRRVGRVAASPTVLASPSGSPRGVLRIVREGPFSSTDAALTGNNFDPQALQLYYATCAGLLTYPDRSAPDGTRLVPDVARPCRPCRPTGVGTRSSCGGGFDSRHRLARR